MMILSIDPGKDKCGLAVMLKTGKVKTKAVSSIVDLPEMLKTLLGFYKVEKIILGNGTNKDEIFELAKEFNKEIIFVSEKNTSLLARRRYFQENPPKGILKFLPKGLLLPMRPIDDYAAIVLGERYFKG
jgi:RNase H-fold protein (predicted Holliday junction resolvase)